METKNGPESLLSLERCKRRTGEHNRYKIQSATICSMVQELHIFAGFDQMITAKRDDRFAIDSTNCAAAVVGKTLELCIAFPATHKKAVTTGTAHLLTNRSHAAHDPRCAVQGIEFAFNLDQRGSA